MSDPLASLRQTACTKLTDVFGGWAFKPLLRGVREADERPPADVFQRSLDDRTLLSALFEDGEVVIELLDVSDGRPRALIERRTALPNALCWDASGDTLLLANRDAPERMTLEVITLSSGKTRTLAIASDVRYIALLSDGRYAVVSELDHGKSVTRVYNLERGTVLRT